MLEPLLPLGKKPGRSPFSTSRQLMDGIRARVRIGIPWWDIPEEYGPWGRVYELLRRRQRNGTWQRIFTDLQARTKAKDLITWDLNGDSTIVRAPPARRRGAQRGTSRGNRPGASPSNPLTMDSDAHAAA